MGLGLCEGGGWDAIHENLAWRVLGIVLGGVEVRVGGDGKRG